MRVTPSNEQAHNTIMDLLCYWGLDVSFRASGISRGSFYGVCIACGKAINASQVDIGCNTAVAM
jgi:hypothetical protein